MKIAKYFLTDRVLTDKIKDSTEYEQLMAFVVLADKYIHTYIHTVPSIYGVSRGIIRMYEICSDQL